MTQVANNLYETKQCANINEKKSATFIPIRPCPNLSYPGSMLPFQQHLNHHLQNIEMEIVPPEGVTAMQKLNSLAVDEQSDDSNFYNQSSKQQKSYEELKVSIVLCGEYLSNLLVAKEKSINIQPQVEESLRNSLLTSLDINLLTSISSKKKKDIIITATKCIRWFERANLELKILASRFAPSPMSTYISFPHKKMPIRRYNASKEKKQRVSPPSYALSFKMESDAGFAPTFFQNPAPMAAYSDTPNPFDIKTLTQANSQYISPKLFENLIDVDRLFI